MKRLEIIFWVLALTWVGFAAFPASYWYNVGQMDVLDAYVGEPIELIYNGSPNREFKGSYAVIVRDVDTEQVVVDAGGGPFEYHTNATRPKPLLLDWWAPSDDRVLNLPVGNYELKTCWTVIGTFWGIVPNKTVCMRPALFRVRSR